MYAQCALHTCVYVCVCPMYVYHVYLYVSMHICIDAFIMYAYIYTYIHYMTNMCHSVTIFSNFIIGIMFFLSTCSYYKVVTLCVCICILIYM